MTQQRLYLKEISRDEAIGFMDDELLSRVKRDGSDGEPLAKHFANIGCFKDGRLLGFFSIAYATKTTIDVHINFTKNNRGYAGVFSKMMLKNLFSDPTINRVESEIPIIYDSMVKFVEKIGFLVEGRKRGAFLKNKQWHDSYIVGITRKDYVN